MLGSLPSLGGLVLRLVQDVGGLLAIGLVSHGVVGNESMDRWGVVNAVG